MTKEERAQMTEQGPIYNVPLIDSLPLQPGGEGFRQAMPTRRDLEQVRDISQRTAGGYEVLLAHYLAMEAERDRLRDLVPHMWCVECEMDCTSADEDGCCSACGVDPISHDAKIRAEVAEEVAVALDEQASQVDPADNRQEEFEHSVLIDCAATARHIGGQSSEGDALTGEQAYGLAVAKEHARRIGGAK